MNPGSIIGIDLGTTYSLAATIVQGQPTIIQDMNGPVVIPSVVSIDDNGELIVGETAKRQALSKPQSTIYSVKRLMGRTLSELGQEIASLPYLVEEKTTIDGRKAVAVRLENTLVTPEEISAAILKEIAKRTGYPAKAVVTVPAYFDDSQRQATRDAGKLAGIDIVRIVNEPTAAALAYGLDRKRNGIVAVYDLGGGTFDCTILSIKDGVFKVLSTRGDTRLGGDDFDRSLMSLAQIKTPNIKNPNSPAFVQSLREAAELAKKRLSSIETTDISWIDPETNQKFSVCITKNDFENCINSMIETTLEKCSQALRDAKIKPDEVDEVVLVGGSSRIPLVQQKVQQFFGRKPHTKLNPDEVVALGAAIQGDILAGHRKQMLLLDVVPLSLGIETLGGAISKLIHRNSPLPARATERFSTGVDNQTAVNINIFQGERELTKDCRKLGELKLSGIPPMPAQMAQVDVTFLVDANGMLTVTAREMRSSTEAKVSVTPAHGLSKDEVDRMVLESVEHAKEDFKEKRIIELIQKANGLINHTRRILADPSHQVFDQEKESILEVLGKIEAAVQLRDSNRIQLELDTLSKTTNPLAERIMNKTVQAALGDQKPENLQIGMTS